MRAAQRQRALVGFLDVAGRVTLGRHQGRTQGQQQVYLALRALGGGQLRQERQGAAQQLDAFEIGAAGERGRPGHLQVADAALEVAAPFEVHRQLGGQLARPLAVTGLQSQPDADVQRRPPRRRDAFVEHLAVESVAERVARRDGAVGPLVHPVRLDELLPLGQRRAARLDLHGAQLDAGGHRGRDELRSGHAATSSTRRSDGPRRSNWRSIIERTSAGT